MILIFQQLFHQNEEGENVNVRRNSEFGCIPKFYDYRLKPLNFAKDKEFFLYLSDNDFLGDIYFKSIYLKNQFAIFAYFSESYSLIFDLFKLNYLNGAYQIDSKNTWEINIAKIKQQQNYEIKQNNNFKI